MIKVCIKCGKVMEEGLKGRGQSYALCDPCFEEVTSKLKKCVVCEYFVNAGIGYGGRGKCIKRKSLKYALIGMSECCCKWRRKIERGEHPGKATDSGNQA